MNAERFGWNSDINASVKELKRMVDQLEKPCPIEEFIGLWLSQLYDFLIFLTDRPVPPTYIPESRIQIIKSLARGAFGEVSEALLGSQKVVIKVMRPKNLGINRETFEKSFRYETCILANLFHDNIVKFVGVVLFTDEERASKFGFVLEQADKRSLSSYLFESKEELPSLLTLSFMTDILKGLQFLKHFRFYHLDLKPPNVLCFTSASSPGVVCKLCDFGLSRRATLSSSNNDQEFGGTPGYAAPELYKGEIHENSDVFSMAMVYLEIITRSPLQVSPFSVVAKNLTLDGERPVIPEWMPAFWRQLIRRMWHQLPAERPNLDEIAAEFETLHGDPGFTDSMLARRRVEFSLMSPMFNSRFMGNSQLMGQDSRFFGHRSGLDW